MNWYVCKSICACSRELLRRSSTLDDVDDDDDDDDDDDNDDDKEDVGVVDDNDNERDAEDELFFIFESWLVKAMNLALLASLVVVHVI